MEAGKKPLHNRIVAHGASTLTVVGPAFTNGIALGSDEWGRLLVRDDAHMRLLERDRALGESLLRRPGTRFARFGR